MMMANELTILAAGPISPQAIDVAWAQPATISREAQAYVDERWGAYMAEAAAQGKMLFNGPVTRVVGVTIDASRLALTLGPTDYKTFMVTTLRDRPWFEANAPDAIARAVGNSVLLTNRGQALLGIRSRRTSAYGGRAHLIGGVLDLLGEAGRNVSGIIAHLRTEMEEEAGMGSAELSGQPVLMAVVQDEHLCQPELIWRWEISTDVETVGRRLGASEHDGYTIIEKSGMPREWREPPTPVVLAAIHYWKNQPS